MNPFSIVLGEDITVKSYHVKPQLWLKATKLTNAIKYEWFMGDTWGSSKPGSYSGLYYAYYDIKHQIYTFYWNNAAQKLHRVEGPAKIVNIKRENIMMRLTMNFEIHYLIS